MSALIKFAALAAVLTLPAAFAADYPSTSTTQGATQATDYSKLDVNGDGNISKDEASADATLSAKFDELDKDKSGTLSTTELSSVKMKEK